MVRRIGVVPLTFAMILGGALTPLLFAAAIMADGNWTFNENTLSDLGISAKRTVALLFNGTCMMAGICVAIFGLGKAQRSSGLDAASGLLMGLSGVFLFLVGIFTKDMRALHMAVACSYFVLMGLAIIIGIISDSRRKRYYMISCDVVILMVSAVAIITLTYKGMEVVYVLITCVWGLIQGLSLAFSKDYNTESDNRVVIK